MPQRSPTGQPVVRGPLVVRGENLGGPRKNLNLTCNII